MAFETIKLIRKLTKEQNTEKSQFLRVGNICMFMYDAKDKTLAFDRTPIITVLRKSRSYALGLNFNWCPKPMRKTFWNLILKLNKKRIKNNEPLNISWPQVKPFILKLGYAPIIRLYIINRISRRGINIPYKYMPEICSLNTADITGYSENSAYRLMANRGRK